MVRFANRSFAKMNKVIVRAIRACRLYSSVKPKEPSVPTPATTDFINFPKPLQLEEKDQMEFDSLVKQSDLKGGLHPDFKPIHTEFDGEKNPVTGEVGGPKGKEPTR